MKSIRKKSFLAATLSVVFAILTLCLVTSIAMFIGEGERGHIGFEFIIYDLVVAVCCYFIVRKNPGSIWYVPVICNADAIIFINDPIFFTSSLWIFIFGGLVLSIIVSIIGARVGKRTGISDNHVAN
jgi:hypothetical protein